MMEPRTSVKLDTIFPNRRIGESMNGRFSRSFSPVSVPPRHSLNQGAVRIRACRPLRRAGVWWPRAEDLLGGAGGVLGVGVLMVFPGPGWWERPSGRR